MPETGAADPESPKPPRFTLGPALLFAACIGMAAWTWMRYSYAWDVTPDFVAVTESADADARPCGLRLDQRYVHLRGFRYYLAMEHLDLCSALGVVKAVELGIEEQHLLEFVGPNAGALIVTLAPVSARKIRVLMMRDLRPADGEEIDLYGRAAALATPDCLYVDTSASRFHGASVAGLVVAAFGGFVFALHLRRWLLERKARAG